MDTQLKQWIDTLQNATLPEDVFGPLDGSLREKTAVLLAEFRRIATLVHPDRYANSADQSAAADAFVRLQAVHQNALERIDAGTYRSRNPDPDTIRIQSPQRTYHLTGAYRLGQAVTIYPAACLITDRVEDVQVEIGPEDPLRHAATALNTLKDQVDYDRFSAYFQLPIETFRVQMGTSTFAASVYGDRSGWYSLADVAVKYPAGIDPRDMAWIFRRMLTAVGFVHRAGIIHGALFPENVLIEPDQHGLMLTNFYSASSFASVINSPVIYLPPGRDGWMPVIPDAGALLSPGFDLYLASQCMRFVLGGDPPDRNALSGIPPAINSFLRGCCLPDIRACPQDAWQVLQEFDQLIEKMWGERQFHPFKMAQAA
jgi:hypothetical protein